MSAASARTDQGPVRESETHADPDAARPTDPPPTGRWPILSRVYCPHCARATIAVRGIPVTDRCPRCRTPLLGLERAPQLDLHTIETRVRERLYPESRGPRSKARR